MFGLSFAELAVVVLVVIILFGPDKLPEVARLIGRGYREMRKISNTIRDTISFEDDFRDRDESFRYIVHDPNENDPNKSTDPSSETHAPRRLEDGTSSVVQKIARAELIAVPIPPPHHVAISAQLIELPEVSVAENHRQVPL